MKWYRIPAAALLLGSAGAVSADDLFLPDAGLSEDLSGIEMVPEVLTATRLKQPRSEVPGSMTVITADHIRRWGVRTIPELMRFVPGMFVKHGDQDVIAYHASNPNLMRRMQVLIDGRSVYRAGIASVVWEDIPVALEDIQRIEVFRGPNASSYGANAFMAVINVVTFHPADSLGSRAYVRHGDQGVRDYQVSHSGQSGDWVYRTTVASKEDDGFDGSERDDDRNFLPGDNLHDGSRDNFISLSTATQFSDQSRLRLEGGYKSGKLRLRQDDDQDEIAPVENNSNGFVMGRWQYDFSARHTSQLRAYWQIEKRRTDYRKCAPAVALSPRLAALYQQDPYWANVIGRGDILVLDSSDDPGDTLDRVVLGVADPAVVEAELEAALERDFSISQDDLDAVPPIVQEAFAVNPGAPEEALYAFTCGDYQLDFDEQRFDVEWQDTMQWSDDFRTVAGVNLRYDEVKSETYFGGTVSNSLTRFFANAEWRPVSKLIFNLGGTYEDEEQNAAVFSPRVAANLLIYPQHSLRLVYSTAVRSPDLLEQSPDYEIRVTDLSENYLNLEEGTVYARQDGSYGNLDHERITSWEFGYYGRIPGQNLEIDIKLFRDHLYQLISDPINLFTPDVSSDTEMNLTGVDWQFTWQPLREHSFWYSGAYIDADMKLGDVSRLSEREANNLLRVETRLSSEFSHNLSWSIDLGHWQLTQSYFWHRSYDTYGDKGLAPYRRYELHLQKAWAFSSFDLDTSLFVHHLIDKNPISYNTNRIDDDNLAYLQVGVRF